MHVFPALYTLEGNLVSEKLAFFSFFCSQDSLDVLRKGSVDKNEAVADTCRLAVSRYVHGIFCGSALNTKHTHIYATLIAHFLAETTWMNLSRLCVPTAHGLKFSCTPSDIEKVYYNKMGQWTDVWPRIEWLHAEDGSAKESSQLSVNPYASVDPAPPSLETDTAALTKTLMDEEEDIFTRYRAMFSLRNKGDPDSINALAKGKDLHFYCGPPQLTNDPCRGVTPPPSFNSEIQVCGAFRNFQTERDSTPTPTPTSSIRK